MPVVTPEDFSRWLHDPVTISYMDSVRDRRETLKELLVSQAGITPSEDSFKRGMAHAFQEVLSVSLDESQGEISND